jgi:excisionase family DNA binding protein
VSRPERRPLATPEQVSEFLGVPVETLYQWRYRKVGPPASKVGRHLRYRWSDVEAYVDANAPAAAA